MVVRKMCQVWCKLWNFGVNNTDKNPSASRVYILMEGGRLKAKMIKAMPDGKKCCRKNNKGEEGSGVWEEGHLEDDLLSQSR